MLKTIIDVVLPMYILIRYSDNYSETSRILRQYYRDEPVLTDAGAIAYFTGNNTSYLFNFKEKSNRPNRRRCHNEC